MKSQAFLPGMENLVKPFKFPASPYEFKVMPLRECPTPESLQLCDTPDKAAEYWRLNVASTPYYDSERENLAVLLLNTRRRVKGHQLVTVGTQDTLLVHSREIFRLAIVTAANGIIVGHNHPSDPVGGRYKGHARLAPCRTAPQNRVDRSRYCLPIDVRLLKVAWLSVLAPNALRLQSTEPSKLVRFLHLVGTHGVPKNRR